MKLTRLDSTQKIHSNDTGFVNVDAVFIIKWYLLWFCVFWHVQHANKHVCTHLHTATSSILPSFPINVPHPPSTIVPPKSKPNTCSGTAQTLPDSCKCQGSNADQPKTKRTRCKTIKANDDNNNENKSGDEQEAAVGVEDDPPASRGSSRGHAMKKRPP